jgi:ribonucleoside-diphosphate reductase alpha chain
MSAAPFKGARKSQPPERRKLPRERAGYTHKFTILAMEHGEPKPVKGYITVGLYEDGGVGEIFVKMAKQGGQVSGFVDAWAISVSMLLQLGVPLETVVNRFENMRFEPSGRIEGQSELALSPIDYVCKYLRKRFLDDGKAA